MIGSWALRRNCTMISLPSTSMSAFILRNLRKIVEGRQCSNHSYFWANEMGSALDSNALPDIHFLEVSHLNELYHPSFISILLAI